MTAEQEPKLHPDHRYVVAEIEDRTNDLRWRRDEIFDQEPTGPHMYMCGQPGSRLETSTLAAENVALGVAGEKAFAKALGLATVRKGEIRRSLLDVIPTYWSAPFPTVETIEEKPYLVPDQSNRGDIDCILQFRDRIVLIDVKHYPNTRYAYEVRDDCLITYDALTGRVVDRSRSRTQWMARAKQRFTELFSAQIETPRPLSVEAYVVVMPTRKGNPLVRKGTRFAGDIPVVTLDAIIKLLERYAEHSSVVNFSLDPQELFNGSARTDFYAVKAMTTSKLIWLVNDEQAISRLGVYWL